MNQLLFILAVVALVGCSGVSKPDEQAIENLAKQSLEMKKFIKGKRLTFKFEGEEIWTQFHTDGTTDAWNHKCKEKYQVTGLVVKRFDEEDKTENTLTFPSAPLQLGDQVILKEGGKTVGLAFMIVGPTEDRSAQSHYANPLPANIKGAFASPEIQSRLVALRKAGHPTTLQELNNWYPSERLEDDRYTEMTRRVAELESEAAAAAALQRESADELRRNNAAARERRQRETANAESEKRDLEESLEAMQREQEKALKAKRPWISISSAKLLEHWAPRPSTMWPCLPCAGEGPARQDFSAASTFLRHIDTWLHSHLAVGAIGLRTTLAYPKDLLELADVFNLGLAQKYHSGRISALPAS